MTTRNKQTNDKKKRKKNLKFCETRIFLKKNCKGRYLKEKTNSATSIKSNSVSLEQSHSTIRRDIQDNQRQ